MHFERLGSTRTVQTDARLIAATNTDLAQMVAEKRFRSDLYYRLHVFPIVIPPLRERRDDILLLVRYFVHTYARRLHKRIETISAQAMAALMEYDWPGNVRELEHCIERAVILSRAPELQPPLSEWPPPMPSASAAARSANHAVTLRDAERALRPTSRRLPSSRRAFVGTRLTQSKPEQGVHSRLPATDRRVPRTGWGLTPRVRRRPLPRQVYSIAGSPPYARQTTGPAPCAHANP